MANVCFVTTPKESFLEGRRVVAILAEMFEVKEMFIWR